MKNQFTDYKRRHTAALRQRVSKIVRRAHLERELAEAVKSKNSENIMRLRWLLSTL